MPATLPIFHTRLEDDATTITPYIVPVGVTGSIEGTLSYTAVKFTNGAGSTADANRARYAGLNSSAMTSWTKGALEFWMLADVTSGSDHMPFSVFKATNKKFLIDMYSGVVQMVFWDDTGAVTGTPMSLVPGTGLVHLAFVWDSAGIDGSGDTQRVYKDGVLVGSTSDNFSTGLTGVNDFTIIAGQNDVSQHFHINGYMDNFKLWDYAKTDYSDRNNEYNFTPDPAVDVEVPVVVTVPQIPSTDISTNKVYILGRRFDVYQRGYIRKINPVTESRTFQRSKLIINDYDLDVKNFDNFFSVDNLGSSFNRISWRYDSVEVRSKDDILIWKGIITDIQRDHKTKQAKIVTKNSLFKERYRLVNYYSTTWETPAGALKNILDAVGYTKCDADSITESGSIQALNGLYVKCRFTPENDMTLQQAIEKLADFSCSDAYLHDDILYFRHYRKPSTGTNINLTEKDLLRAPTVESLEDDIINDYSIRYYGDSGTAITDATANNIGAGSRERYGQHSLAFIDGTKNSDIIIRDVAAAKYIGECYIRRTHSGLQINPRPLTKIAIGIPYNYRYQVTLQDKFRLTLSDESWNAKLFEIFEFTIDYDENILLLTAYEVDE